MKFVFPKTKWEYSKETKNSKCVYHCDNPYTTSSGRRIIYIHLEQNLRTYPRTVRSTEDRNSTCKIHVNVKKLIHRFKGSYCVAERKTKNEKTLHADLLLIGIAQLITVIVVKKSININIFAT